MINTIDADSKKTYKVNQLSAMEDITNNYQ